VCQDCSWNHMHLRKCIAHHPCMPQTYSKYEMIRLTLLY
jgi:hypothetical protein